MTFTQVPIITSGDMSLASITSNVIDLSQFFSFSIQAVFTGSPNGTIKMQFSCDEVAVPATGGGNLGKNVVNWTDYTGSSQSINAAGNCGWIVATTGFRWVRLIFTMASGSGTLNATFNGQGV